MNIFSWIFIAVMLALSAVIVFACITTVETMLRPITRAKGRPATLESDAQANRDTWAQHQHRVEQLKQEDKS